MSLGKLLLVVGIVLLVFWYVAPDTFKDYSDKTFKAIGLKSKDKVDDNDITTPPIINETNNVTTNETSNETDTEIVYTSVCDWPFKGYPDYEGTVREGQTCTDPPAPDLACLANPPKNYAGTIDLLSQTSDPEMRCCISDGTCRWKG